MQSAIANLRKKCKVRVKREVLIDLTNDDDVDDHAASERVRADIIDSSRLVEGENGFEVEGQHASS